MTDNTRALSASTPSAQQEVVPASELEAMRARKDAAYEERNKVVAALAKVFPSGVARTAIEGWSDDWHGCVYIDLPTGQVSWHFHDSQAHLFAGLPPYTKGWDGHDTPEKYRRLAMLAAAPQPAAQRKLTDEEMADCGLLSELEDAEQPAAQGEPSDDVLSLLQRARLYTNSRPLASEPGPFAAFRAELDAAIVALGGEL